MLSQTVALRLLDTPKADMGRKNGAFQKTRRNGYEYRNQPLQQLGYKGVPTLIP
jgi:hypothetical protein